MGKLNIHKPETKNFKRLFMEYNFNIPDYQRPYRWTKKQFKELIDDLELIVERDDEHFFGSIILTNSDGYENYVDVVDGQQRLTTIIFILILLEKKLNDEKLRNFLIKENNNVLDINISNERQFIRELFNLNNTDLNKIIEKTKNDSYKTNLQYFNEHFDKVLNEKGMIYLKKIKKVLLEKLIIIEIKTDSLGVAYTLFEVLNNRGLELSVEDLLKNHFLRQIQNSKKDRTELLDLWTALTEKLKENKSSLTEFLRIYFIGMTGKNPRANLYDEIKNFIEDNSFSVIDFMVDITNKFEKLEVILNPNKCNNKNVRKRLLLLPYMNNQYWKSVLVACIQKEFSDEKIENIIISLEKLNSLYWIAGYTSQKVRDPQLTLILMIKKGEAFNRLERFMKKKEIEQDVYSRVKKNLETNSYSPRWGKYILAKYELEIDDSSYIKYIDLNDNQIQIEHIMPQTRSKGWSHIPENDYEQHVNNIGNLTLLSGGKEGKNQKIGNWSFEKKKEIYKGINQTDEDSNLYKKVAFRMIDDIIAKDSWNLNIIKNRSEAVIETLFKAWSIKKIDYNLNDLKIEFGSIENLRDELEEFVKYHDLDYRNKFLYFLKCLVESEEGISRDDLKKKINDKFGKDRNFVNGISIRLSGNEKIDLLDSIGFEKEGRVKDNYFIKEEQKNNIQELLEIEND